VPADVSRTEAGKVRLSRHGMRPSLLAVSCMPVGGENEEYQTAGAYFSRLGNVTTVIFEGDGVHRRESVTRLWVQAGGLCAMSGGGQSIVQPATEEP
jgi:hypothetical protein